MKHPDRLVLPIAALLMVFVQLASAQAPAWSVASAPHEYTMNVTAALEADGLFIGSAGDVVCAYAAADAPGTCRGIAAATLVGSGPDARHLFFLTVYGTDAGETIRFQAYDADGGVVRSVADSLGFSPNAIVGDPATPFAMNLAVNLSLAVGWNLVGYDLAIPQPITDGLAALIADGKLTYAVGFDDTGATLFDPNGLPFLNTLNALEPRRGYWLKLATPHDSLVFPTPAAAKMRSVDRVEPMAASTASLSTATAGGIPRVQFIRGTALRRSDGRYANVPEGQKVEVLTADGRVLASAAVLHDGLLMTTPVYGEESAPVGTTGAAIGDVLHFRLGDQTLSPGLTFQGTLEPVELNLIFDGSAGGEQPDDGGLIVQAPWPNPASDEITLRFTTLEAGPATVTVYDVLGRSHGVPLAAPDVAAGTHVVHLDAAGWAPGVYVVVVRAGDARHARSLTVLR